MSSPTFLGRGNRRQMRGSAPADVHHLRPRTFDGMMDTRAAWAQRIEERMRVIIVGFLASLVVPARAGEFWFGIPHDDKLDSGRASE